MNNTNLKILLRNENAVVPYRFNHDDAGYDLSSSENSVIPARQRGIVKTGISIGLPPNTYGRVAPRSGLAVKKGINVGAGVVDRSYTGEICVVLFNHSDEDFEIKIGDRIAQLIIECILTSDVEIVTSLNDTIRGENGFGSSG
jgi:dUTP pyrophosphatase